MRQDRVTHVLALVFVWVTITGCATAGGGGGGTTSSDQVRNTIYSTNRMVEDLNRTVSDSMASLTTTSAEMNARIDAQEQELRRLSSLSVENQRKLEVLQQSLDELTVTLYRHFNLTPPPRTSAPISPGGARDGVSSGVGDISVTPPTSDSFSSSGELNPVTVLPPTGAAPVQDSVSVYNAALEQYKAENYTDALTGFTAYQQQFPGSDKAADAQYWKAQCYFRLGDYQRALGEYEQVWTNFPNNPIVPTAMHNSAVSYSRIGENARAIEMFQRLIREYPDDVAAESARSMLRELQGLN